MVWERLGSASVSGSTANTSWKELGRTTLSSAGDTIDVSSFTAKDNLMIIAHGIGSGNSGTSTRFNADTGSNYSNRWNDNGGSDGSDSSAATRIYSDNGTSAGDSFYVADVTNISNIEKLGIWHNVNGNTAGAGNAPARREIVGKWANTSSQITSVNVYNGESGDFASGAEVVVLGMDNDEADSGTNFWQELVSKELTATSSSNPQLDTGTFAAKKYLWVNMYLKSNTDPQTTFNNDTGSNYAWRYNDDGGSDGTSTSTSSAGFHYGAHQVHVSAYIVNSASKEKLYWATITYSGGNAAASTAPVRRELVGKWTNTSDQITSIQSRKSSMNMYSNSWIKVYGAD